MKQTFICFLLMVCYATSAFSDSFLTAQSFPSTVQDLSFQAQMELKSEDYELYRPVYDNDGFCVKNCAYPGLNIKQEKEISDNDTEESVTRSLAYQQRIETINTESVKCSDRKSDIPVGQKVPWGEPLKNSPTITSLYGPRILNGEQSFHDGMDFAVVVGTPVYVTADGRVVKLVNDNKCGIGLRIQHEDGTQTIYCHLSKYLVQMNEIVGAGCKIAESGNTGHSTGPHLHYGIRDVNGHKIDPSRYTGRSKN